MTLAERFLRAWRRLTPELGKPESIVARVQSPHVQAEYLPLYTYLHARYASNVTLTFVQMESLLGFALPASARTDNEWWTDPAVRSARHSEAWTVAQRRATPNLIAGIVAFERAAV